MTAPALTPAMERALDWLLADSAWRWAAPDGGIQSLKALANRGLAEKDRGFWRATPSGLALKAQRAGEGT